MSYLYSSTLIISLLTLLSCDLHAKDKVKSFVNQYCIDCHNEKKSKASVRFDNADFLFEKHASVYFWQDTLDVLNVGEMPPEDEKHPNNEELKDVIGEITDRLQKARKRLEATGGVISMRHLNRREYAGSIKDLFGAEVPTLELPLDAKAGYDTNGSDQFFTSNHYESYLNLAQKIVRHAIENGSNNSEPQTVRYDPEDYWNELKKGQRERQESTMALIKGGADYKEAGFPDKAQLEHFKRSYYRWKVRLDDYFNTPHIEVGTSNKVDYTHSVRPASLYRISVEYQSTKDASMPLMINQEALKALNFKGKKGKNQSVEFSYKTDLLTTSLQFYMKSPSGAYIDNLKISGPHPLEESFFVKVFKTIFNQPEVSDKDVSEALQKFAERAFRYQKVSSNYINKLMEIYKSDKVTGRSVSESLVDPIAAIISAADFLYIKEKNRGKRQELTQHEFAIRLAYFLWGAPPDEQLYEKVKNKTLFQSEVLNLEVARMLGHKKADVFLASFINQWSEMDRFDEVDLPKQYLGNFQASARKELSEFFKVLVRDNLSVDHLIDSDFVVIDSTLASHYKIKGEFTGFQKTELPEGHPRGGMLSQAAFLIMGTSGERTSPTIRGTIIRETFLHDPPAPPPPNVPQIEADSKNPQSVRDQVQKHKEIPQCASCHEKIDPIGYGLENFDYLGKWRTTEVLGKVETNQRKKKKVKAKPKTVKVDASGFLSKHEKFDDFEGLKKVLYQKRDRLALSIYESILSYGIGRDIEFVDEEDVTQSLLKLKKDNYRLGDMIMAVVTSETFKTK